MVLRGRFSENRFEQLAAWSVKKQSPLLDIGEVHRAVGNAELVKFAAEGVVVVQPETDVIDGLGCGLRPVAPRADDVHERPSVV